MESRNVTLTLDKAKEFYNSGNEALKEVALQAFTENEIKSHDYTTIKTFEDACEALDIDSDEPYVDVNMTTLTRHLKAIYKIDIISKALNGDWIPSMVEGKIYYPFVRFYPAGNMAREAARSNNWRVCETFKADGKKYSLVGGGCHYSYDGGLGYFGCGCGVVQPDLGLLGCKSREIAEHMSRYFAKEIFEATYAHHVGSYKWI